MEPTTILLFALVAVNQSDSILFVSSPTNTLRTIVRYYFSSENTTTNTTTTTTTIIPTPSEWKEMEKLNASVTTTTISNQQVFQYQLSYQQQSSDVTITTDDCTVQYVHFQVRHALSDDSVEQSEWIKTFWRVSPIDDDRDIDSDGDPSSAFEHYIIVYLACITVIILLNLLLLLTHSMYCRKLFVGCAK